MLASHERRSLHCVLREFIHKSYPSNRKLRQQPIMAQSVATQWNTRCVVKGALVKGLLKLIIKSISAPRLGDMGQNSITTCYKLSYIHGIVAFQLLMILHGWHLRDLWLGSEGSQVQNLDKTSLFFLLLLTFILLFPQKKHIQSYG